MSEEQKKQKEVEKAEAKAESARKDFDEKRAELRASGAWWDEPSVVARLKQRMEAQADRCCELEIDAITKRHYFEEWCATKKLEMTERVANSQRCEREVADMKWLSEHYDVREALREARWKLKAAQERHEQAQLDWLQAQHASLRFRKRQLEREGALQRLQLAMYDPRWYDLWSRGVI